jgi:serine/threonine-protein kinase
MALSLPGYRITKQVGVGARSTIHLAVHEASGKSFAIKHVARNSSDDADSDPFFKRFIEQVETEYAVTSKIKHPYLRHSYEMHRVRKLLQVTEVVLVMEYVHGLDFEKARPNRLTSFLAVFEKVARGLQALHESGYVHSDIKPTNIMIGPKGVVKIIDFGQSCPVGHKKERIQGTPDYIAPEQVRRSPLDERTDVYNLGATMYWVLTSENYPTAIQGTDSRGGMRIVSSDKPLAPIELNDKIPLSLSQLVMECCRDNPAERPGDMQQVVARLAVVQKLWRKYREGVRAQWPMPAGPPADDPSIEPQAPDGADAPQADLQESPGEEE